MYGLRKTGLLLVMLGGLLLAGSALAVEPVANDSVGKDLPKVIYVRVVLLDLEGINSADQNFTANVYIHYRWHDPRERHKAGRPVIKYLKDVWHPECQIINQQRLWQTFAERVTVMPDGEVLWQQRVWGNFSQPLRLRDFPQDSHTFSIRIAVPIAFGVKMVPDPEYKSFVVDELSVPDWGIEKSWIVSEAYRPLPEQPGSPGVVFSFKAHRFVGFFVVKIILPLALIVAMACVVFWIDPQQSGTQIGVAMTSMLTLIAYRFAIGATLPDISYLTRIDRFVLGATTLVFATLVEVVYTATLVSSDKLEKARKIDRYCRWGFPALFVMLIVVSFVI